MSLLARAEMSKKNKPFFVGIHGDPATGKSTMASGLARPFFIDTDSGLTQLNVLAFKPSSFSEVMSVVEEAAKSSTIDSIVIDTISKIEKMISVDVAKAHERATVADVPYGKGQEYVALEFKKLMDLLSVVRETKNVFLISHTIVRKVKNPIGDDWIRYEPDLNEKSCAIMTQALDALLYSTYEMWTKKQDGKMKGFGEGARVIYTENRPGYLAKNRFNLPHTINMGWEEFTSAVDAAKNPDNGSLKTKISEMLTIINDSKLTPIVIKSSEDADHVKLRKIIDKLSIRIEALNA